MNTALTDLYREVILEHGKRPRNYRCLEGRTTVAEAYNPLCGDALTVYLELTEGLVRTATFQGRGCVLSIASASMMTEAIQGRALHEVAEIGAAFDALIVEGSEPSAALPQGLAAFAAVRAFPSRVKCTLLAWRALRTAVAPCGGNHFRE